MIRFIAAAACLLVGIIVAPFAYSNPVMNSADFIVVACIVGFAFFALPIGRHDP